MNELVEAAWPNGSVEHRTCNLEAPSWKSRPDPKLDFFWVGSPGFKSSAMLGNSRLVHLLPVGILSHIKFHLNYQFHYRAEKPREGRIIKYSKAIVSPRVSDRDHFCELPDGLYLCF